MPGKMRARSVTPRRKRYLKTTAEVLAGIKKAYEHFEQHTEGAWKATATSNNDAG
jgi:hypothetical protein